MNEKVGSVVFGPLDKASGGQGCGESKAQKWNDCNVEGKLELLRQEVRALRRMLKNVADAAYTARLQVQNHSHTPTGQPNFPAAVFERAKGQDSRDYDPLA